MTAYRNRLYNEYYSNHSGVTDPDLQLAHFEQQVRYFTREIIPHLPADKNVRILDIGCGTGSLLMAMKRAGYSRAEGVDLSPEQLKMALEFGVDKVTEADALKFLQDHTNEFDVITGIDVLEHQTKNEAVEMLDLIKASLKSGGSLIMRFPNMDAPMPSVFAHADLTHELFLNKSSASQLFKSTGFSNVQVYPGLIYIEHPIKELLRKAVWWKMKFLAKISLFASGRTWHDVEFSPNIVVLAQKD